MFTFTMDISYLTGIVCGKLQQSMLAQCMCAGMDGLAGSVIPYSAKFSRDKIFADWPFTKFRRNNFRGLWILWILVSHAQSDAAQPPVRI